MKWLFFSPVLVFLVVLVSGGCDSGQNGQESKTEPKAESKPMAEAEAPIVEEKDSFDVVLTTSPADKKIQVIKVVREITGLSLKESKELVEGVPKPVKEGISKEEAESLKKRLQEVGGTVELK